MKKIRWFIDHFEETFMVISLGGITVAMFAQVVSRYVFRSSLVWTEELSRYFLICLAFMGLSYGVRTMSHLRIDIFENLYPKLKKPLEYIGDIFVVAFFTYMLRPAFTSIETIWRSGQVSPAMEIPFFIVYMPLAIGLVLGLVRMAEKYAKYLLQFKKLRDERKQRMI
ncbi:MAG: TRAP transporter small permease [Defluviitaleaceae bacterium]|nr:TRAP transporter small permease [Defluviitaleaceae bacterium]